MLKGRWSTVMDDAACRAHQEMMVRIWSTHQSCTDWLHCRWSTPRIHWRMKLQCLVSCLFPTWFVLHDLIKFWIFYRWKVSESWCALCAVSSFEDRPRQMTQHTEHIQRWMALKTEHTKDPLMNNIAPDIYAGK